MFIVGKDADQADVALEDFQAQRHLGCRDFQRTIKKIVKRKQLLKIDIS